MITRRRFLKLSVLTGGGVFLSSKLGFPIRAFAAIPGGTLDLGIIAKYQMPLIIPPAMPRTGRIRIANGKTVDYYEIAVRQFQQQILPPGLPPTTVWSYGSVNHPGSFNYPAFTLEAKWQTPVRVKWINDLKDPVTGDYLPHILPVDPTLHWANPPGGTAGRDMRPMFMETPGAYTGPVPIVTHLHGSHATQESDGYTEAWYLPAAGNIPAGFATEGSWYNIFKTQFQNQQGVTWQPGNAVFQYANNQRPTTMWYHDHTLGMTRLNVYAGPAGFYLLRGGPDDMVGGTLPGPAPALGDLPGLKYYEIPIAIQDRAFNADGSLFYPDSRQFFDGFAGPYIPDSDIAPIWNPEFFGNTMVVNGRTWPYLEVEPRRYRLRLLNGCNSRFLILKFSDPALSFWQIGSDGGFLPAPVQLSQLLMSPAERMDVIVDFSGLPPGAEVILQNLAPDQPFGGGVPGIDFVPADPATTGQVMQFRVVPAVGVDKATPPALLTLPALIPLGPASLTRQVSLNEEDSAVLQDVGPMAALLGTLSGGDANPLEWKDTITENPAVGATEVWEMYNYTADAHPIHIHEVQFQVVDRQPFAGAARTPEANETGFKDTVIAYPGEITRIKARFELAGLYVWHCHIVEHEDNEMMRPYFIGVSTIPTISGFWPGSVSENSAIIVFGSNFVPNQTQVAVGGVPAPVMQVLEDDLLFFLPPSATASGLITVTTPSGRATSSTPFGVPLSGLVITGIWPAQAKVGETVFVFGNDFVPNQTSVQINNVTAPIHQVLSSSLLFFLVPPGASTGLIRVSTPIDSALSSSMLTVVP